MPTVTQVQRQALCELIRDVDARKLAAQQAVSSWRNFTLAFCAALAIVLPLFAIVLPHLGVGLATIRGTSAGGTKTVERLSTGDLAAIEMWGALGGLVGIIAVLSNLRLTQRPSSLQIAQLVLKPLAGGVIALFAIVLLQAGLVQQVRAVDSGTIAAYAVLFGFSQQLLTRALDRRAATLLDTASTTAEKSAA